MATESYLRGAIAQLQGALVDLQMQIHGSQQHTAMQKHALKQQVDSLVNERLLHRVELGETRDTTRERMLNERITQINRQCDLLHARQLQLDRDLARLVQSKTGVLNTLQGLTRQLDLMLASADVRS